MLFCRFRGNGEPPAPPGRRRNAMITSSSPPWPHLKRPLDLRPRLWMSSIGNETISHCERRQQRASMPESASDEHVVNYRCWQACRKVRATNVTSMTSAGKHVPKRGQQACRKLPLRASAGKYVPRRGTYTVHHGVASYCDRSVQTQCHKTLQPRSG